MARIAQSIERCGQIVPCIVAPAPGGAGAGAAPLVLIDGCRRVAALRRLGRGAASVWQSTCGLAEAVLGVFARAQDRSFAVIEEALLLRELMQGQGLSQQESSIWLTVRAGCDCGEPDGCSCCGAGQCGAGGRAGAAALSSSGGQSGGGAVGALPIRFMPTASWRRWPRHRLLTRELQCWLTADEQQAARNGARPHGRRSPPVSRRPSSRRRGARRQTAARRPRRQIHRRLHCLKAVIARLRRFAPAALPSVPPALTRHCLLCSLAVKPSAQLQSPGGARSARTPAESAAAGVAATLQRSRHSLRGVQPSAGAVAQHRAAHPPRADGAAEAVPCDEATFRPGEKAAFEPARGNVVAVRELLADDGLEECPPAA